MGLAMSWRCVWYQQCRDCRRHLSFANETLSVSRTLLRAASATGRARSRICRSVTRLLPAWWDSLTKVIGLKGQDTIANWIQGGKRARASCVAAGRDWRIGDMGLCERSIDQSLINLVRSAVAGLPAGGTDLGGNRDGRWASPSCDLVGRSGAWRTWGRRPGGNVGGGAVLRSTARRQVMTARSPRADGRRQGREKFCSRCSTVEAGKSAATASETGSGNVYLQQRCCDTIQKSRSRCIAEQIYPQADPSVTPCKTILSHRQ